MLAKIQGEKSFSVGANPLGKMVSGVDGEKNLKIVNNAASIVQSLLMVADESGNDDSKETYVRRAGREINDLRAVFRKNWLLGVFIVVALSVFSAYKLDLFKKKDEAKDNSQAIAKLADSYIDLNTKYQKLLQETQQNHDAEKDAEIAKLKQQISEQKQEIDGKAQSSGSVMVPDPTAYGGQKLVSAEAVKAWTACVQKTSQTHTASGSLGPFSFGGSVTGSSNECNKLLIYAGNDQFNQ